MVFVMNITKINIVLSWCSTFHHLETLLTDYYKKVKVVQIKNLLLESKIILTFGVILIIIFFLLRE